MMVALALLLLTVPLVALYVLERMARAGKGPLAEPDRMVVLDGTIVPAQTRTQPAAPAVGPINPGPPVLPDSEGCVAESCLVVGLMTGRLTRAEYHENMADLAAQDAAVRPVRLPPKPA